MSHTTIEVLAPDTASPGELLEIQITIYNSTVYPNEFNIDFCCPVVRIPGDTIFGGDERHIPPKEYHEINYEIWTFNYTMPAEPLVMTIESWFETDPIYEWHLDNSIVKQINLGSPIGVEEITLYVVR